MKTLRIFHLYPEMMNQYGDRGNVIALARRIQWHGIRVVLEAVSLGAKDFGGADIIFIGGGPGREQKRVCEDLRAVKGEGLSDAAEDGAPFLVIGEGYQLLGRYCGMGSGELLEGLGLFDAWTEPGDDRLTGNVVIESDLGGSPASLVGFENHSGRTYLGPGAKPLGRVIRGFGNNGRDGSEGAVYKNTVGTYLHGSLLPKNAWLADWMISKAMERRYGEPLKTVLDDTIERIAHEEARRRALRRTV